MHTVEALAGLLREHVEAAGRGVLAAASALDRRFLARVAGALNAYEAARALAAADRAEAAASDCPRLLPQACGDCGSESFSVVAGAGTANLLCRDCGACWQPGDEGLRRVDIRFCPGCDRKDACVAAAVRRLHAP